MSGGRFLLLFLDDDASAPEWIRIDGGVIAARGGPGGAPLPILALDADERILAVVPASDVAVHWIDLPRLAPAQALAAARLMAADASAEPIERLHVALGADGEPGTPRAMAVTSVAQMAAWLNHAATLGVDPDGIVPESLLIAPPEEGVRLLARGDVEIVRGPMIAFAAEPELAALAAEGVAVERLDQPSFEAGLPAALAAGLVDLRQGAFAKRRRMQFDWKLARRLAWLGVGLLVATLLIQLAMLLRYSIAADGLERQTEAIARRVLPRASSIDNPATQLANRLAELRGGGAGFAATSAAVFAAVRDTPNVDLSTLQFDSGGSLQMTVMANGAADVAALQQRLTGAGFAVSAGAVRPGGGRQMADLTVRPQ
ncbi:MAG: ral secretion pathway protein [Sphingomonas bacterium]|nr:ral secretion pathway protein [Sphingomonas bacterium]